VEDSDFLRLASDKSIGVTKKNALVVGKNRWPCSLAWSNEHGRKWGTCGCAWRFDVKWGSITDFRPREDPASFPAEAAKILCEDGKMPTKRVAYKVPDLLADGVATVVVAENSDPVPSCSYAEDSDGCSSRYSVPDSDLAEISSSEEYLVSDKDDESDESSVYTRESQVLTPIYGELDFERLACRGLRRLPELRIWDGDYGDIYIRRDGKCVTFSGAVRKPFCRADFGIDENEASSSEEISSGEMFLMSSDDDDYELFVPTGGESGGDGDAEDASEAESEEAPLVRTFGP
jgi:hypothetical protein